MDFKCNRCGAPGPFESLGRGVYRCKHCYNDFVLPKFDSNDGDLIAKLEKIIELRNTLNFDRCEEEIDGLLKDKKALENNSVLGEIYFQKFLCDYGIVYVDEDGVTLNKPTINRLSPNPCLNNANYQNAIINSKGEALKNYKESAAQIEAIRSAAFDKCSDDEPYDVFISLKVKTFDKKGYTADDKIAREIYDYLSKNGYRVFYSEETLKRKAGSEYEPIIYHALYSASVFLLICTDDVDYINAPWVRNEWTRFLKRKEENSNIAMVSVVSNKIKIESLPSKLAKLQALNYDPSFYKNLNSVLKDNVKRRIKTSIKEKDVNVSVKPISVAEVKIEKTGFRASKEKIVIKPSEDILLTNALQTIEKGVMTISKARKANEYFNAARKTLNSIIAQNEENYLAYWYLYLCDNQAFLDETLKNYIFLIDEEKASQLLFNFFSYAPESVAIEKLNILVTQCKTSINQFLNAGVSLYNILLKYVDSKTELDLTELIINKLIDDIDNCVNKKHLPAVEYVTKTIYPVLTQIGTKGVINYYDSVARAFRKKYFFEESERYQNLALELFKADPDALWNKMCLRFKISDDSRIPSLFKSKKRCAYIIETIENMLSGGYKIKNKQNNYINQMIDMCIKYSKINVNNAYFLFTSILSILPNAKAYTKEDVYNSYFYDKVTDFSEKLLMLKKYNLSMQLSKELISNGIDDYRTHWNILKADKHLRTNFDLLIGDDYSDDVELYNNILIKSSEENVQYIPSNIMSLRLLLLNNQNEMVSTIKSIRQAHLSLFESNAKESLNFLATINNGEDNLKNAFNAVLNDYKTKIEEASKLHAEKSVKTVKEGDVLYGFTYFVNLMLYLLYFSANLDVDSSVWYSLVSYLFNLLVVFLIPFTSICIIVQSRNFFKKRTDIAKFFICFGFAALFFTITVVGIPLILSRLGIFPDASPLSIIVSNSIFVNLPFEYFAIYPLVFTVLTFLLRTIHWKRNFNIRNFVYWLFNCLIICGIVLLIGYYAR